MLNKLGIKTICLLLGILAISSLGIQAEVRKREWIEYHPGDKLDGKLVHTITTKVINNTKYKILLVTEGEGIARGLANPNANYVPIGSVKEWLSPGQHTKDTGESPYVFAPKGTSKIYFSESTTPRLTTHTDKVEFELKGENHEYNDLPKLKVAVQAEPVNMYYDAIGSGKPYIYPFWNYTITVKEK